MCMYVYMYTSVCVHIYYTYMFSLDSEADGCVRVPRPARRQLPGHGAGGRPPSAAGRLLRQQDQRARRPERPAPALAGGSLPNRALHEGEAVNSSYTIASEKTLYPAGATCFISQGLFLLGVASQVVNDLAFSSSSDASVHAYNIHVSESRRVANSNSSVKMTLPYRKIPARSYPIIYTVASGYSIALVLFADRGVALCLQGSQSPCHIDSHLGRSDGNSLSG